MNINTLESFKISDSITFHDELNPKLFHGQHLKLQVKKQLLTIAQDFLEELGVKGLNVKDITISGSNAAFSYTPHSDLDLHILVDMSSMGNDEVYQELFNAKKTLYNNSHKITCQGIPVELYIQDAAQGVVSLGEYSILHDKWLRYPTKRRANLDQTSTKAKYDKLVDLIHLGIKTNDLPVIKKVLDTVKRYRQAGLAKGGEFGPENLAFKAIRTKGYLTKLYALRDKLHSASLSTESMYNSSIRESKNGLIRAYHGNQGGIDTNNLVTPMWFTQSLMDAKQYAGSDGFVIVADLDIKNPYVIKPGVEETNAVLEHWWDLKAKGYDGIYDAKVKDWIPFNEKQIHIVKLQESNDQAKKLLDKPTPTIEQLVAKHGVSRQHILGQLDAGIKAELEHTGDRAVAKEIALDHLNENPDYYTKLKAAHLEEDDEPQLVEAKRPYVMPELRADRDHLIYVIINNKTGERYVGITAMAYNGDVRKTLNRRMQKHLQRAQAENKSWGLCNSLRKYGPKNFTYGLLEIVPGKKEAHDREMNIIGQHKPALNTFQAASHRKIELEELMSHDTAEYTNLGEAFNETSNHPINDSSEVRVEEGASGYIPSKSQANDPRFKTALTVDVKPATLKKNAKAFGFKVSRAGLPPEVKFEMYVNELADALIEGKPVTQQYFQGSIKDIVHNLEVTGFVDYAQSRKFKGTPDQNQENYYMLLRQINRFKQLPGGNPNFKYAVQRNNEELNIVIVDDKAHKIVGALFTTPRQVPGMGVAYHVESIAANPEYRGQNVGYGLYGVVVVVLKQRLISGDKQTPDARRMWTKMAQLPGVSAVVISRQGSKVINQPLQIENGVAVNYPTTPKSYVVLGATQ